MIKDYKTFVNENYNLEGFYMAGVGSVKLTPKIEKEIVNAGKGYLTNISDTQDKNATKYWKFFKSVEEVWEYQYNFTKKVPFYYVSQVEYNEDTKTIKMYGLQQFNDFGDYAKIAFDKDLESSSWYDKYSLVFDKGEVYKNGEIKQEVKTKAIERMKSILNK